MNDSYARTQLNSGEEILLGASIHWIVFADFAVSSIVLLGIGGLSDSAAWRKVLLALWVLNVLAGLWRWIEFKTTEMVITDRRVIFKSGFIVRNTHEQQLAKRLERPALHSAV